MIPYSIFEAHPVVTTDSRDCPAGSIFIAMKGEHFNGNAYARQALDAGCSYAVIDDPTYYDASDPRLLMVADCLKVFQELAREHRRRLGTRVIGITGTNGKTTTKELVSTVLSQRLRVLYTQGNYNNDLGVPKTLVRLRADHDIAVIEMGASHPGDIRTLVNIVEPDYGLITNVGKAHLQGFGSFEGVLRTKGELYDYLRGRGEGFDGRRPGPLVFINNDNPHLCGISHGLSLYRYGQHADERLEVEGELIDCNPFLHFRWRLRGGAWHEVQTQLIGAYNLDNALAAASIGHYFGISEEEVSAALSGYRPSNNRSQLTVTARNRLVVDAYNANPTSMHAALENFRLMKVDHKMCIIGQMGELGDSSAMEHQRCVDDLAECGFEEVWLVGELFAATRHPSSFRLFRDVEEVSDAIAAACPEGRVILIKGSNSTRLFTLPEKL